MDGDDYSGYDDYIIRSLYFDSIYNDDYEDKMAGIERRSKIRIRTYNGDNSLIKLELKEKQGDAQLKRSLGIEKSDVEALKKCDYGCLRKYENHTADDIFFRMSEKLYRPAVLVQYRRKVLSLPTNDIRITFDFDLKSNESDFDIFGNESILYPAAPFNEVVLEIKYNNFLLSYIENLINKYDLTENSNSKYCRARYLGLGGR